MFRTKWAGDGDMYSYYIIFAHKIKQLLLLEARMDLEFTGNRFDLHQWKYCFEFRNRHIGDSDESCQSVFDKFFTLSVCIHEFFHTEWFRIRIS